MKETMTDDPKSAAPPEVLNRRVDGVPPSAVYVGRPTKWGNPYTIHDGQPREEVIELYRKFLTLQPEMVEAAKRELRGKDLVCWCAPLPCHADVLLEVANG